MHPIEGELADRVREAYSSEMPTRYTSKNIIEQIAAKEGITAAKVRHILTWGGPGYVRWTKADRVWEDEDGKIKSLFDAFTVKSDDVQFFEKRRKFLSEASDELLYTTKALTDFAQQKGFWPWVNSEKRDYISRKNHEEALENKRIRQNEEHDLFIKNSKNDQEPESESKDSRIAETFIKWAILISLALAVTYCINRKTLTGPQLYCIRQGMTC